LVAASNASSIFLAMSWFYQRRIAQKRTANSKMTYNLPFPQEKLLV
jgi:hypothetical protein